MSIYKKFDLLNNVCISNTYNDHHLHMTLSFPACMIMKLFKYKEVVAYDEYLDHDGYNEAGPESDLWDLYVVTHENGEYFLYRYHWENWYEDDSGKYEFIFKKSIKYMCDDGEYNSISSQNYDFHQFIHKYR